MKCPKCGAEKEASGDGSLFAIIGVIAGIIGLMTFPLGIVFLVFAVMLFAMSSSTGRCPRCGE